MAKLPIQLQQAAELVHQSGKPKMIRVKDLLSWFGAQRRGVLVVSEIRKALKKAKVVTVPDFEVAYIDQRVKLKVLERPTENEQLSKVVVKEVQSAVVESASPAVVGGSIPDPAPRIGM